MGDRKWENLPADCLVEIFGRVGLDSLVEGVPYVCKSWYQATLNPNCWQSFIVPDDLPISCHLNSPLGRFWNKLKKWPDHWVFPFEVLLKFVIHRSHGLANVFVFAPGFHRITEEVGNCIGEGCPYLKRLVLPYEIIYDDRFLPSLICKWRNLEALEFSGNYLLKEFIPKIGIHCKKFVSLTAHYVDIYESEASAIVSLLPNLEFLSFRKSFMERDDLVIILKGLKKLVHIDACFCNNFGKGFDNDFVHGFGIDDEIMDLVADFDSFKFDVSEDDHYEYAYDAYIWELII